MMGFSAGGGQGDDVLNQVDNFINGRITMGGRKTGNDSGKPSLMHMLVDGLKELLGGGMDRRKDRDNRRFRGEREVVASPPADGSTPTVSPDGREISPTKQFLDEMTLTLGGLVQ